MVGSGGFTRCASSWKNLLSVLDSRIRKIGEGRDIYRFSNTVLLLSALPTCSVFIVAFALLGGGGWGNTKLSLDCAYKFNFF